MWDVITSPKKIVDIHGIARCLAYEMSILDENRRAGSIMLVLSNCHMFFCLFNSYFLNLIIALIYWSPFRSGHLATCSAYLLSVVLAAALRTRVLLCPFHTLEISCCKRLPWPGLHSWPVARESRNPRWLHFKALILLILFLQQIPLTLQVFLKK